LINLFSKYCNINNLEEYTYLFESVLNTEYLTKCDNEVDKFEDNRVIHILACDYADRILIRNNDDYVI
jgi:hypothetical protein